MEIIIEEISRGHKVINRQKFGQNKVAIGRGYHNDVLISDPHVCAEHLTIAFDGENWRIQDLDSINGSFLGEGKKTADGHIVHSGDIIRVGKSQIRILFPFHPVEESITLSSFENLINLTKSPLILITNVMVFALITGWLFFLNNPTEVKFTQLLVSAAGLTLMFAVWPVGVAIVSLLTKHDARIWTQLGICFVFYNLSWVTDFLETVINFNTASGSFLVLLASFTPIVIAFCLFWLNIYIGFHVSNKRRMAIASGLTILLVGGSFLIQVSKKPDFSIKPEFNSTLLTPSFLFTNSSNVDEFINNSNELFKKVDEKAKKKDT
ncbi:FHA domain-containing protein [Thalassotalea sp. 1_MG-2023]|uniref:FHA domain-containing protein n=1 Tax=Thalassotalea sp. 1_MG-2023 TaxID=3062680 RepID=UPI0026E3DB98|nr:FHA domain-containing protein [Thalassotalea sp. 1_MG-2023]MDO6426120.1 FHA domain-containing protein [Thalassotalea sp. 1_MG-2023]